MERQPTVAQIFEYVPGAVSLVNFPSSDVFEALRGTFGREVLLERYTDREDRTLVPSFPVDYIEERQRFFQKAPESSRIRKNLFEKGLPKIRLSDYNSNGGLAQLCEIVDTTLAEARKDLMPFKHMPEARGIFARAEAFYREYQEFLSQVKEIDAATRFGIDTEGKTIWIESPEKEAPDATMIAGLSYDLKQIIGGAKIKMKRELAGIAQSITPQFRKRLRDYVKGEFGFGENEDNLRRTFEQFAVPIRLHAAYSKFLEIVDWWESMLSSKMENERWGEDWEPEDELRGEMPESAIYPKFSDHYDIEGLIPPSSLTRRGFEDEDTPVVPINFYLASNERKVLFAGLNSGSKSFHLDNLCLTLLTGLIGFPSIAQKAILPRTRKIYYYKGLEGQGGLGRAEAGLDHIARIIDSAGKDDAIFIDECLDGVDQEVTEILGPKLMDYMGRSPARVFVVSHRIKGYQSLANRGWTIFSPDYTEKNGLIEPAKKLSRGAPKPGINARFIRQRHTELFEKSGPKEN